VLPATIGEGGLIALAGALGWWLEAPPFDRFRVSVGGLAWGIGATAPLLLALRWCLRTGWSPVARLVTMVQEKLSPLFRGATVPELALLALLAGVAEEALFRGVIQDALGGWLPAGAALIIGSLLFGVAHWVTTTYAVLAGIVGVYLGALYLVTGNLLAPIVTHALYDFVALFILARLKPAPPGSVV
jgi:membrane protease YdiL (CAAX protease family)